MGTPQFTEGTTSPPLPISRSAYRQLLPNLYDGMAYNRPEALYAMIPRSFTSYEEGYRKVTYREFVSAVNGVAWLITSELGKGEGETLAYVGGNDIGYIAVILGAVKAGYSILATSPRNTKADHKHLFEVTGCKTVLTQAPPYSATVETIIDALPEKPRIVHVPNIFELLDAEEAEHYPYTKIYEEAKDEPMVIVHTSGSTGKPKPVVYTHAFANASLEWNAAPPPKGYKDLTTLFQSQRSFLSIPFFYSGTISPALWSCVATGTTVVAPLGGIPPSIDTIAEGVRRTSPDGIILPAPFMEQIAQNPRMLDLFTSNIRNVGFGGGDISQAAGDAWASRVTLVNFNGSTEATAYPTIRPVKSVSDQEWKYIQPHPVVNLEFRATADPELFEGVIVKNNVSKGEICQPIFRLHPELDEWNTNDLWSPHPSKPGLWKFKMRKDDMINSATGELYNPLPMEQALSQHPFISAAIMAGTSRYQNILLIEPVEGVEREGFVDRTWEVVREANELYPVVSRISKTHVLLTEPGRPLKRATKETVQRAPSLEMYKEEIERLYEAAGDGDGGKREPYLTHKVR